MKLFILFISIFFYINVQATCEINSYERIFKINKVLDSLIIKNSNCPEAINQKFIEIISNANGKINNHFISNYIDGKIQVRVSPKTIKIESINTILSEQLSLQDLVIVKTHSLLGKSAITLDSSDLISVQCKSCNDIGTKNIKLNVNQKQLWLTSLIGKKVSVYRPIQNLNRQTPILSKDDFTASSTVITSKGNYFTDIANIRFYRLNRNLDNRNFLKNTDLTAKNLVTFGQKVNLKIKTKSIELKSVGTAKKGGRLGDFIEVQNPKSQKIFLGKIIDYNKVLVEL